MTSLSIFRSGTSLQSLSDRYTYLIWALSRQLPRVCVQLLKILLWFCDAYQVFGEIDQHFSLNIPNNSSEMNIIVFNACRRSTRDEAETRRGGGGVSSVHFPLCNHPSLVVYTLYIVVSHWSSSDLVFTPCVCPSTCKHYRQRPYHGRVLEQWPPFSGGSTGYVFG